MFKKIFGGSKPDKEEKPKEVPQQQNNNPIPDYKIQFEQSSHQIREQEEAFEKKIDKYTLQIDKLRGEAKEYIKKGQKKKAQFKLVEIKSLENYIERAENQKQTFFNVRMQLQHGLENKNAAGILKQAAQLLKTVNTEDLQDAMEDIQEHQQTQAEVDALFAQNAQLGQDQDELDDMFKDLQNEIDQENAGQLQNAMGGMPAANINPAYQQPQVQQQQQQYQQQQQQQPQQKNDAFNDALLDQLAL